MTTEDLTALQALRAKMTPGEWQWRYDALGTDYPQWSIQPGILIADGTDGTPGGDMIDKANAAGIVALVNAAPALLASAARAAELEQALERISDAMSDAVQSDCENGVKWLNERAAEKYLAEYPATLAAWREIGEIIDRATLGD